MLVFLRIKLILTTHKCLLSLAQLSPSLFLFIYITSVYYSLFYCQILLQFAYYSLLLITLFIILSKKVNFAALQYNLSFSWDALSVFNQAWTISFKDNLLENKNTPTGASTNPKKHQNFATVINILHNFIHHRFLEYGISILKVLLDLTWV